MQDAWLKHGFGSSRNPVITVVFYKTPKCITVNFFKFASVNLIIIYSELPLFLVAVFYCAGS